MREKRITDIVEFISRNKMCTINELCENLGVSKNTIRKDIQDLAEKGLISKVHGGIVYSENNSKVQSDNNVIPYNSRVDQNKEAKQTIGKLAAALIESGDTIFIDSGTTTPYILPHITHLKNVHIVTNNLHAINESKRYGLDIYCLGGVFVPKTDSFVGGIGMLDSIRISKAFMGTSMLSVQGMTNFSFHEAEMKRSVISHSNETIIVADHLKFGKTASICFCQIKDVSTIVTDKEPPQDFSEFAEKLSVRLLFE